MKSKITNKATFILLFFIILNTIELSAQSANQTIELKQTISILNQKVDTLEQINAKILNSIYWTLGTLGTIFTAFLALNFFSNLSINKNKIESIREELLNNLNKNIDTNEKNNNDRFAKINEQQHENINQKTKDIDDKLTTKIETHVEQISAQYEILDKKMENFLKDYEQYKNETSKNFNNRVNEIVNPLLSNIESKYFEINDKVHELKRSSLEEYLNTDKHPVTIKLKRCLELLDLDREKNWEFRIHSTLEKLLNFIKSYSLSFSEISDVQSSLEKLDQKAYNIPIENLIEILKTKNNSM